MTLKAGFPLKEFQVLEVRWCYGLNACALHPPPPLNSHDETLTPSVIVLGNGALGR